MSLLSKILQKIFPSVQSRRVKPWVKVKGDKTLRLNYDLSENSVVFDLGGYEGQWASDIFSKYQSQIFVFEPFKPYANNIRKRFINNGKISVFEFGLGHANQILTLYSQNDASSIFMKEGAAHEIEIKKATDFIKSIGVSRIDLIKINIEGGEYDLLDELISSGFVREIVNIQIQFHDFVPNSLQRMEKIQEALRKTHSLSYQYQFVWENWVLNEGTHSR